jgi:hypothetical protein
MDIGMVSAAYTGLKFAKDALQVALGYKIETETRTQITAALEKLGAAQDTLFELREALFSLQGDNDRLRQELAAREKWEAQKAAYHLTKTAGGAVVYASDGPPPHLACPVCFSKNAIQILQDRRVMGGVFDCPGCKAEYPVNPIQEMPMPEIQRGDILGDYR